MPKYIVRKRKWPKVFKPLKRPWELIRTSDGKPVSFFKTAEEAQAVAKETERGVDLAQKLLDRGLVKRIGPTGTMRGQNE